MSSRLLLLLIFLSILIFGASAHAQLVVSPLAATPGASVTVTVTIPIGPNDWLRLAPFGSPNVYGYAIATRVNLGAVNTFTLPTTPGVYTVTLFKGEGTWFEPLAVSSPINVAVAAAPPCYVTTTTAAGGGGYLAPLGTTSLACGSSVTFSATPVPGYSFINWSGPGCPPSASPAFTMTVTGDVICIATFSTRVQHTVSLSAVGPGEVSGAGTFEDGALDPIVARPSPEGKFLGWSGYCLNRIGGPSGVLPVYEDFQCVAHFGPATVTVTVTHTGSGTVGGGGTYPSGSPVTLSAVPDAGASWTGWTADCATLFGYGITTGSSHTITVTHDVTCGAAFTEAPGASTGGWNSWVETPSINVFSEDHPYCGVRSVLTVPKVTWGAPGGSQSVKGYIAIVGPNKQDVRLGYALSPSSSRLFVQDPFGYGGLTSLPISVTTGQTVTVILECCYQADGHYRFDQPGNDHWYEGWFDDRIGAWRMIATFPASLMAVPGTWYNGRGGKARQWMEVQGLGSDPPIVEHAAFFNTFVDVYTAGYFPYPNPNPEYCNGHVDVVLWATYQGIPAPLLPHNEGPYDSHWPNEAQEPIYPGYRYWWGCFHHHAKGGLCS